jgi:peptidoglycan/LPS O-acetylase OafA/YrhL
LYLDAFRGIAALWVLVFHFDYYCTKGFEKPFFVKVLLDNGYLGVTLFFVISSFSMGLSSDRHLEDSIKYFYIRRFFRIAPLYYLMLAIGIIFINGLPSYAELALNVVFAFNFFERHYAGMVWAGWTIGIEMPFYIVFPLLWKVVVKFKERGLFVITVLSVMVVFLSYQTFKDIDHGNFWLMSFFRFLLVFIMGLWVYSFYKRIKDNPKSTLIGNFMFLFGFTLFFMMILGFYRPEYKNESYYSGLYFSLILLGTSISNSNKGLNNGLLKWLGKNSFSIYLLHPVMIYTVNRVHVYEFLKYRTQSLEIAFYGTMMINIVATCVLSELAWRLIEKPGIDLGNKIVKKLKANRESIAF